MNLTTPQAYLLLKAVTDTRKEILDKYKDDYFTDGQKLSDYINDLDVIISEIHKEFHI